MSVSDIASFLQRHLTPWTPWAVVSEDKSCYVRGTSTTVPEMGDEIGHPVCWEIL